jgi:hypothetical protein
MTAARLELLLALVLSAPFPVHGELDLSPPGNPLCLSPKRSISSQMLVP